MACDNDDDDYGHLGPPARLFVIYASNVPEKSIEILTALGKNCTLHTFYAHGKWHTTDYLLFLSSRVCLVPIPYIHICYADIEYIIYIYIH